MFRAAPTLSQPLAHHGCFDFMASTRSRRAKATAEEALGSQRLPSGVHHRQRHRSRSVASLLCQGRVDVALDFGVRASGVAFASLEHAPVSAYEHAVRGRGARVV